MAALAGKFSKEIWTASVQRFIFGHSHMWFLYMLIGFYILIPVARQICAKKEVLRYYIILWGVFRFLLPCLTNLFHLYTLQARLDALGLDILIGYFGYFILGYYLNVTDIKKEVQCVIYVSGMIAAGLTAFLTVRDCRDSGTYVEKWFGPSTPNVLIMSVAVFIFFKYCKVFDKVKKVRVWEKLSGYTFFVYMFHLFVIEKLNLIGITTISYPVVISIPVITVFTFMVSLFGAFVAAHIPVIKKAVMLH